MQNKQTEREGKWGIEELFQNNKTNTIFEKSKEFYVALK